MSVLRVQEVDIRMPGRQASDFVRRPTEERQFEQGQKGEVELK